MRYSLLFLILLTVLLPTTGHANISYEVVFGSVVEFQTGEPFEKAVVTLVTPKQSQTVYTDDHGRFSIDAVSNTVGRLFCRVQGWKGESYETSAAVTIREDSVGPVKFMIRYDRMPPVHEGMVGYWPLNGDAQDIGPHALHGEVEGATGTADWLGGADGAMAFNGASRITMPDDPGFSTLPMTIVFRMRIDTVQGDPVMFLGKYVRPSGEGYVLFIEKGALCAGYFRGGFNNWTRLNAGFVADKKWHHVVLTIDDVALTLFLDEARIVSRAFTEKPTPTTSSEPFRIGKISSTMTSSKTYGLVGALDDLMLFDRALTEDEIRLLRAQ